MSRAIPHVRRWDRIRHKNRTRAIARGRAALAEMNCASHQGFGQMERPEIHPKGHGGTKSPLESNVRQPEAPPSGRLVIQSRLDRDVRAKQSRDARAVSAVGLRWRHGKSARRTIRPSCKCRWTRHAKTGRLGQWGAASASVWKTRERSTPVPAPNHRAISRLQELSGMLKRTNGARRLRALEDRRSVDALQ